MRSGYAPHSSPNPPGLSWYRLKRRNNTGFSRMPSRLAHRAQPIRQYWTAATSSRLLPPSPATPGSGCLQLHAAATTAARWWSLTPIRNDSASWRTACAGRTRPPRSRQQHDAGRRRSPDPAVRPQRCAGGHRSPPSSEIRCSTTSRPVKERRSDAFAPLWRPVQAPSPCIQRVDTYPHKRSRQLRKSDTGERIGPAAGPRPGRRSRDGRPRRDRPGGTRDVITKGPGSSRCRARPESTLARRRPPERPCRGVLMAQRLPSGPDPRPGR